jgi:hypothetical protein
MEDEEEKVELIRGDSDGRLQQRGHKDRKEDLIFEILPPRAIDELKGACIAKNYPLIEEYDFRRDQT